MKKPTQKQIDSEIKKLKDMKPNVTRASRFGDNHHDAIDAQVEVLSGGMTESQVYDKEPDDETEPGDVEELGYWKENVISAALEACRWRDGEEKDPPSKGWKDLIIS